MSFSSDLRAETTAFLAACDAPLQELQSLAVHASARADASGFVLETRHQGYFSWLRHAFQHGAPEISKGGVFRLRVGGAFKLEDGLRLLRSRRAESLAAAFALLFAACGSMAEPERAAHIEYRLKHQIIAAAFLAAAGQNGIELRTLPEKHYVRLYSKDSPTIGDLLIRSGAMNAYIRFSQLKVDKEVLNNVNRQVNCDRANARRVAETSADQAEAIRRLDAAVGLSTLPETLEAAARARLEHPDLSLTELGAVLQPPIGKSGMNHRLKKILALADELED